MFCLLFMSCQLFVMSAIGSFHCTAFLHEHVFFSLFNSLNLMTVLQEFIPEAIIIPWIYRSPWGITICVAFSNDADCPNSFSVDEHSFTSKLLFQLNDTITAKFGLIIVTMLVIREINFNTWYDRILIHPTTL